MTSTVTEATRHALLSHSYGALTGSVGIIAISLLVVLLIQKEVVRALDRPWATRVLAALDAMAIPLLLSFALIVTVRFVHLLR